MLHMRYLKRCAVGTSVYTGLMRLFGRHVRFLKSFCFGNTFACLCVWWPVKWNHTGEANFTECAVIFLWSVCEFSHPRFSPGSYTLHTWLMMEMKTSIFRSQRRGRGVEWIQTVRRISSYFPLQSEFSTSLLILFLKENQKLCVL